MDLPCHAGKVRFFVDEADGFKRTIGFSFRFSIKKRHWESGSRKKLVVPFVFCARHILLLRAKK